MKQSNNIGAEENVEGVQQDVAMFWDVGSLEDKATDKRAGPSVRDGWQHIQLAVSSW